ncbi:MAG TPA: helix-turn-helix domain-containing protein [Candidatus Norongarragalinales archaeon]|nr:helix-turn-helix domain-containing protein [Candidatus Norongarragalinales archaeon]
MWVARLKVWHSKSYTAEKTRNKDAGYASLNLNSFKEDEKPYLSRMLIAFGPEWEKIIHAIQHDPRLHVEEIAGRQVYFTMPMSNMFHPLLMDQSVFFLKPIVAEKGVEFWTVGSHRKADLKRLYEKVNALRPEAWAEWISLKKERLDLFAHNAYERLSEKQREAFEQAVENGYYTYPRMCDLKKLAKKLNVPATTLRIHLRKAEAKLMPALRQSLY